MDFDFTPEQYALLDLAHDLFEKESSPARLRDVWSSDGDRDDAVWRTMAKVGLLGLTVPEEHGGLGGDAYDLVLVLEEAGYAAVPEPLLETVAVGAPALAGTALADEWLPRVASGDAVITVWLRDAPYVVDADVADLVLLERDGDLVAYGRDAVTARRVRSDDHARRLFAVDVSGDGTPLGADAGRAFARGAVATAGLLNGIAMRLLETTATYVGSRQQFGRPVGSFQAVKHKLVDVHVALETARASTWYAAYALSRDLPGAALAVSAAKAAASDAEALANREALQLHGGIGFTWEHDLHLWLKRGKALEVAYGSAADHRARIAAELIDAPAGGEPDA